MELCVADQRPLRTYASMMKVLTFKAGVTRRRVVGAREAHRSMRVPPRDATRSPRRAFPALRPNSLSVKLPPATASRVRRRTLLTTASLVETSTSKSLTFSKGVVVSSPIPLVHETRLYRDELSSGAFKDPRRSQLCALFQTRFFSDPLPV